MRTCRYIIILGLAVIPFALPARASSLKDYEGRVQAAQMQVASLLKDPGQQSPLNSIRELLPAEESVELDRGPVAVSNVWLHAELDSFSAESDLEKRINILSGISERLAAIIESVDEIDRASAAGPTKDADKRKIAEILQRQEYQKAPPPEESLFQRWSRSIQEWLDRAFPKGPEIPAAASGGAGGLKLWLQILIYTAALGLIVFLLYRFIPFFSARFAGREKSSRRDRVVLGERVAANESAVDLFAEAEQLARAGDLRSAIRKAYIALLCELDDRRVIGLARNKTNRDYLRDLRKRVDLLPDVQVLTNEYERSWYGFQPSLPEDWDAFKSRYRSTVANVK